MIITWPNTPLQKLTTTNNKGLIEAFNYVENEVDY
jgi:hypothetical protein